MRRRGFLAGLLAAPILPHLPVPAQADVYAEAAAAIWGNPCREILFDVETSRELAIGAISQENALFSYAFNTGRSYVFPDRPVIPTKTAKFCRGE